MSENEPTPETRKWLERLRQRVLGAANANQEQLAAIESVLHELSELEQCWTHARVASAMHAVGLALETAVLSPILRSRLDHIAGVLDVLPMADPPGGIPW